MYWSYRKEMLCCEIDDLKKYGKTLSFPVVVEYNNGYSSKVLKRSNYKKFLQKADKISLRKSKPKQLSLF
jgi:hypothetical protein